MHRVFDLSSPTHRLQPTQHGPHVHPPADHPSQRRALPKGKAKRLFIALLCAATVLLALVTAPKQWASPLLSDIPTTPQRAKVPGYERHLFGAGWLTPSGAECDTRDLVITAQGANAEDLCTPAHQHSAHAEHHPPDDPYSSEKISTDVRLGVAIEIDHIIPLSAAWDLGAHSWDHATRVRFANDPLNLVAVSKSQNQAKSDQLPSQWLPPKRGARCWYVNRMAEVAYLYQLPLPEEDVKTMKRQCLPNLERIKSALSSWA